MNTKKIKFLTFFITFGLTFLCHFIYTWFPNVLTSIFFPVNESIWEHMKMLFTAIIIGGIIELTIIKIKNIKLNNIFFTLFFKAIISIPIFLTIYLPIYYLFGENMIISISIMTIVIVITEIISYKLQNSHKIEIKPIISVLLIITTYIIFSVLTYYPPKNEIFYDKQENKYGINNYTI